MLCYSPKESVLQPKLIYILLKHRSQTSLIRSIRDLLVLVHVYISRKCVSLLRVVTQLPKINKGRYCQKENSTCNLEKTSNKLIHLLNRVRLDQVSLGYQS